MIFDACGLIKVGKMGILAIYKPSVGGWVNRAKILPINSPYISGSCVNIQGQKVCFLCICKYFLVNCVKTVAQTPLKWQNFTF